MAATGLGLLVAQWPPTSGQHNIDTRTVRARWPSKHVLHGIVSTYRVELHKSLGFALALDQCIDSDVVVVDVGRVALEVLGLHTETETERETETETESNAPTIQPYWMVLIVLIGWSLGWLAHHRITDKIK
jgi:uncharacterized membrane protein YbjE (DUF340 family)